VKLAFLELGVKGFSSCYRCCSFDYGETGRQIEFLTSPDPSSGSLYGKVQ